MIPRTVLGGMVIGMLVFENVLCISPQYTHYIMDEMCESSSSGDSAEIKVHHTGQESSIILRATNRYLVHGFNCTVKVQTRQDRRLLYSIAMLDLPFTCKSSLQVWGESVRDSRPYCSPEAQPHEKESHSLGSSVLNINLYTTKYDWNFERKGFELVITAYRENLMSAGCSADEFQCANKRCIWKGLSCDHRNNCGDSSDEVCGMSMIVSVIVIIVCATVLVVLIGFLISCIRKRRQMNPYDSRTTSVQSFDTANRLSLDNILTSSIQRENSYIPLLPPSYAPQTKTLQDIGYDCIIISNRTNSSTVQERQKADSL